MGTALASGRLERKRRARARYLAGRYSLTAWLGHLFTKETR